MDRQYSEFILETEVLTSWKDGLCKGLIIGVALGATSIALLGLAVCPRV